MKKFRVVRTSSDGTSAEAIIEAEGIDSAVRGTGEAMFLARIRWAAKGKFLPCASVTITEVSSSLKADHSIKEYGF